MKKFFKTATALAIVGAVMMPAISSAATGWNIQNLSGYGLPNASITSIVINILDWLLMLFGILGIIGFLISGVMYIIAAGNEGMMEQAKEAMKYSIIGVLVGLAGLVAIGAINAILDAGMSGPV
jgi:cytochrome bd-type quinol oxidase subunit 2